MTLAGRILLEVAAVLVAAGGLYDLLTPRLPENLAQICGANEPTQRLVRELLRALGGALATIGITSAFLVGGRGPVIPASTLVLAVALIVPAELVNALSMYRVKSPFYIPLAFALLAALGAALAWPR